VGTDSHGSWVDFTPALAKQPAVVGQVCNWKTNTDYDLDLGVLSGSPAIGCGVGGSNCGSTINIQQYKAGDFNGDSVRDIPAWPPEE
jgi:hypothetical protein